MDQSDQQVLKGGDDDDDEGDEDEEEEILLEDDSSSNGEDEVEEETPVKKRKRGRPPLSKGKMNTKKRKPAINVEKMKVLLNSAKKDAKKEFEAYRDGILAKIPKKYKISFGQIGFTKWNKGMVPVLILSPFQVPPGEVRSMWISMFEKKEKTNGLNTMSYLIYWYGAADQSSLFGFIAQNSFIPYEKEASKGSKGCHELPPKIKAKAENGSALNAKEKEKVKAYQEMEEDLQKDHSDRRRGIIDFPEGYDLLQMEDVEEIEDESDEEKSDDSSDDGESLSDVSSVLAEKKLASKEPADDVKPIAKRGRPKKTESRIVSNAVDVSGDETVKTGKVNVELDDIGDDDSDSETDDKKPKARQSMEPSRDARSETLKEGDSKRKKGRKKKLLSEEKLKEATFSDEEQPSSKEKKKPGRKKKVHNEGDEIGNDEEMKRSTVSTKTKQNKKKAITENEKFKNEEDGRQLSDEEASVDESPPIEKKKPGRKKKIVVELEEKSGLKSGNQLNSYKKTTTFKAKAMFDKPSVDVDDEQILFQECERRYLAKVNRWKECIEQNDVEGVENIIAILMKVVDKFSAPFVQAYGIVALSRQTENMLQNANDGFKVLKANLFLSFAKKKDNVPKGFKPKLGQVPINPWHHDDAMDVEESREAAVEVVDEPIEKEETDDELPIAKPKKVKSVPKEKAVKVRNQEKELDDLEEADHDDDVEKDDDFSMDDDSSSFDEGKPLKKRRHVNDDDENPSYERKRKSMESDRRKKKTIKNKEEKQMTDRGKILKEHIDFKASQQKFLPLIEKWKSGIDSNDVDSVKCLLEDVSDVVKEFSATFIEVYGLSDLLKGTKQLFKQKQEDLTAWSSLREKLKICYTEKSALVPASFRPKMVDRESGAKMLKSESNKEEDSKEKSEQALEAKMPLKFRDVAKVESLPKSQSTNSLDNASKKVAIATTEGKVDSKPVSSRPSAPKPERKKFSLSSLMKPAPKEQENRPLTPVSLPQVTAAKVEKKVVDVVPSWVKDPPSVDLPKDDPRLFALEFLSQMAGQFPEGKVNVDSVARSIEIAIFEWATKGGGADENSNWTERYWGKVHAIVAAVCGKYNFGTLMNLILKGQFDLPEKLLELSEDDLVASFEGRPLNL